jgi:hypothetical protein
MSTSPAVGSSLVTNDPMPLPACDVKRPPAWMTGDRSRPVTFFDLCSPTNFFAIETREFFWELARPEGLEPSTPGLEDL